MKICVLCGGRSSERDVSLSTGTMVARALRASGHRVVFLDACEGFELNGMSPSELYDAELPIAERKISEVSPDVSKYYGRREGFFGRNVLNICREADIVFNALHGGEGENGMVQAVFDLMGIRYTGSGMQGCILAMNKQLSKQLFAANGIPTPPAVYLTDGSSENPDWRRRIGFPCVVKPGSLGSSVGVSIVHNDAELDTALDEASKFESLVIIEKYIHGREFSVGIVGGKALPAIEIIPKHGFYDYRNKYQADCTEEICPAELDEAVARRMGETALKVFDVLDLGAYARIDFMMDDEGFYVLEANTLPGMTPISLLPQEAKAAGMSFSNLLETIIEESLTLKNLTQGG